jgi:opacity protein-like surface antigen
MKKTLVTLLASIAMIGAASAADLPSKAAPPAPAASAASAFGLSGFYVGGNVGGNFVDFNNIDLNKTPYTMGVVGGYEWNKFVRTEATFDYTTKQSPVTNDSGQLVFGNAVVQYPVGFGVTPYALAGIGYGFGYWDNVGEHSKDRVLYNIGGGLRYDLTKSFELDGRYRYINAVSGTKFDNNQMITLGVNYKF